MVAEDEGVPRLEIEQLRAWLSGWADQSEARRCDRPMLRVMQRANRRGSRAKKIPFWFEHTENSDRVMAPAGKLRVDATGNDTVLPTLLLQEMRLEGSYRRTFDSAFVRYLASEKGGDSISM